MWPRYQGVFVRRPVEHDAGDEAVPEREAVTGRWGLISAMTKTDGLDNAGKLSTFNARSETAPKSFTFGNAWRRAQHCIIPADAIFEPDWRSGAAVATRFTRADGAPPGHCRPLGPLARFSRPAPGELHHADHQCGRAPSFQALPPPTATG
ncbi:hypothetical protein G6F59_016633 [Rhizopus arrhizus]|nr:hypothetical protein G6F59_016633 [Rhizopus arrhizus]